MVNAMSKNEHSPGEVHLSDLPSVYADTDEEDPLFVGFIPTKAKARQAK